MNKPPLNPAPRTPPPAPASASDRRFGLVALDVDGTLLRTDKKISRRTLAAVRRARDQGVHVVLATARPPRSARPIHETLGLETPLVCYNGALIHEPRRRRTLFHQPLPLALTRRMIGVARRMAPTIVVSLEILDKWYTDHFDETLPTETSKAFTPDYVGPLEAILRTPVTKLMLLGPPDGLAPVHRALVKTFKGQAAVLVSDTYLLQVIHPDADKGVAVARVASQLGVTRERVLAIGDAPNDLGMLQWAGLGVAVANAWDQVRKRADHIVPSCDQDGVAVALERWVLGEGG